PYAGFQYGSRPKLDVLSIVHDRLHQRLTQTLGHASVDLALEGQRVDDRADVVHDDVVDERDDARGFVDLQLAHVTTVGKRVGRRREGPRLVEAGFEAGRQLGGLEGGPGDLPNGDSELR